MPPGINAVLRLEPAQRVPAGLPLHPLSWLDLRFAFSGADGLLRAELAADAVHLNEAGCRRWAQALAPRLRG